MNAEKITNDKSASNHGSEAIMPNFLLMWKDEIVASVHIYDTKVEVERFDVNPIKQIFYKDEITRFEFGEIIKLRCWDKNRPDIDTLLGLLGLSEFNPFQICQKTHGKMAQDRLWFKFDGEAISYKDIVGDKT